MGCEKMLEQQVIARHGTAESGEDRRAGHEVKAIHNLSNEKGTNKLLTVSIAAYNAKSTLRQALDSCLTAGAERLEVIVVDDGSTDNTAQIVEEYIARRPEIFRLICQPNSGYGSAQMAALAQAQGKYFRTLDSDDWFDPEALAAFLDFLASCESDVVFTNYCTARNNRIQNLFYVCEGHEAGRIYTFDTLEQPKLDMEIHGLTFRTGMLHQAGIRLLPHCSYTDMAYTFLGMTAAQTLSFCPVTLYHYRLGRDGQSVSIKNYQKHFEDYVQVTEQILDVADKLPSDEKGMILSSRARDIAQYGIELLLRFAPESKVRQRLEAYDRDLCKKHPSIAKRMHNKNTRFLRTSRYMELSYRLANWNAERKTKPRKTGKAPKEKEK